MNDTVIKPHKKSGKKSSQTPQVSTPQMSEATLATGGRSMGVEAAITQYLDAHCLLLNYSREFPKQSLGKGLGLDPETLKDSGINLLFQLIQKDYPEKAQQSFWVSTNIQRSAEISNFRKEAHREIGSSPELRHHLMSISNRITSILSGIHSFHSASRHISARTLEGICREVFALSEEVTHPPKAVSSPMLRRCLEQISENIEESCMKFFRISEDLLHNRELPLDDSTQVKLPLLSRHENRLAGWITGASAAAGFAGIAYTSLPGWVPIALATLSGGLGVGSASFSISNLIGEKRLEYLRSILRVTPAEERMHAIGMLLCELCYNADLHALYPDKTSYAEESDGDIVATELRNPKLCMTKGDCVPSHFILRSGRPLIIQGINGGGKTNTIEAFSQNLALDDIGLPTFSRHFMKPQNAEVLHQVPEQSKGALGGGRFETEGRRTRSSGDKAAGKVALVSLDEIFTATSRKEGRRVALVAIAEFAATHKHVIAVVHDQTLASALLDAGLVDCMMPEVDPETGAPTYRIIQGLSDGSGPEPIIDMSGLHESEQLKRIISAGGDVGLYRKFREVSVET